MWKVMIVDDEPKIRRGLRTSIDWAEWGMEIAGEAEDGEIGLAMARELMPDILLVDICMPFVNGLEFAEKVAEFLPEAIVIVISGHDEFAYAQKAVKLGVFDYLLKPVSKAQLLSVLENAGNKLKSRRQAEEHLAWANDQLNKNMPVLRERFFTDWIRGRIAQTEIDGQIRFLGLDIAADSGMILIRIPEKPDVIEEPERCRQVLLLAIQNMVETEMALFAPNIAFRDSNDHLVVVSAVDGECEKWCDAGRRLETLIEENFKLKVIVRQQKIGEGLHRAPVVYDDLLLAVNHESRLMPVVQSAKNFIESNFSEADLSLETVAKALKISPSYLSRLLKQQLGSSFIEHLTNTRIKNAIRMLNDPHIKIYTVAEAVGYSNQHYFSTAFKKMLGISPAEYRKG